jgi:hypothetical protein
MPSIAIVNAEGSKHTLPPGAVRCQAPGPGSKPSAMKALMAGTVSPDRGGFRESAWFPFAVTMITGVTMIIDTCVAL